MKFIGENEVRIQLKESTGPAGPAGADGKDGTSVTHSWRGTTLTVTSASGTSSADLKGEKGEPGKDGKDGATGPDGPAGADGKDGQDGVSPTVTVEAIDGGHRVTITDANRMQSFDVMDGVDGKDGAGGSGSSVELDTTLTQSGKAADAKAVGDKLTELNEAKANDADLAAVAKSGSYNDLSEKPMIPTVPSSLPNPNKLKLTGAVSAEYDGSSEVSVEIPAGGGSGSYTLPVASATQLGGVMPVAATEDMTQDVGVTSDGKLKAPAVSAPSDEQIQTAVNAYLEENPASGALFDRYYYTKNITEEEATAGKVQVDFVDIGPRNVKKIAGMFCANNKGTAVITRFSFIHPKKNNNLREQKLIESNVTVDGWNRKFFYVDVILTRTIDINGLDTVFCFKMDKTTPSAEDVPSSWVTDFDVGTASFVIEGTLFANMSIKLLMELWK